MHLTICSYPRSGRHATQAIFYSLGNFKSFTYPLAVKSAAFFDMMDTPSHWGEEEVAHHIASEGDYGPTGEDDLVVHATHHLPCRFVGPKIVVVRHPAAVAVSVAKKWRSEMEAGTQDYWDFLKVFIDQGACAARRRFGGNVWQVEQTHFLSTLDEESICVKYEQLTVEGIRYALHSSGIECTQVCPPPDFGLLQEKNPVMYRQGLSDKWVAEIGPFRGLAARRYRWILQEFDYEG